MRKVVFSILLMICAMSSKAQSLAAPSSENSGIAVFEGDIKNVPDGTVVNFWFPENGDYIGEAVAKVVKGKFTFKKKINENAKYLITLGEDQKELAFLAALGTTKFTGDSADCSHWRVDNDNPMVVEENAFRNRKKAIKEEYQKMVKLKEMKGEDVSEDPLAEDRFYANSMFDFMKDRPYSPFYKKELIRLRFSSPFQRNTPEKSEFEKKRRELCLKIPFSEVTEFWSLFGGRVPNVGDKIKDFTLYDHDGKEHHLEEFGNNNKYLLMEFCSKEDKELMKSRPESVLEDLYKNYSNYLDIVTINCDVKEAWMSGKLPRDKWNEWNDYNNSLFVRMNYSTIFRYVFISPENKIIGFGNSDDLKDKVKQHFAFVK